MKTKMLMMLATMMTTIKIYEDVDADDAGDDDDDYNVYDDDKAVE